MLKKSARLLLIVFLASFIILCMLPELALTWGFYAHKLINGRAVDSLPADLRPFFEAYRAELSEKAIDPDLWRDKDPEEAYRHYIDIDMYGAYPFSELPRDYAAAEARFGSETIMKRGTAPWWIAHETRRLTRLMQAGKTDSIVVVAAALGHYVSDLYMPLHTVENYDGQLTGNKGIHGRFEWHMIERFGEQINLNAGPAGYVEDARLKAFEIVLNSYRFSDEILSADNAAKQPSKTYASDRDYDEAYYTALYQAVGELAVQQMSRATSEVASYWYTAWINAGKPTLSVSRKN